MNSHLRADLRAFLLYAALPLTQASAMQEPTFYLSEGAIPGGDLAFQAALPGGFEEVDFESFAPETNIDALEINGVLVDFGLGGVGGTATTVDTFAGSYGSNPGTVEGVAVVNRDFFDVKHSRIVLEFDPPVSGVGAWIFDDSTSFAESCVMYATDVLGSEWQSPVLESGNGTTLQVEGFLGVISPLGISSVAFENISLSSQEPLDRAFELDHLQVGAASPCQLLAHTEQPRAGIPPNPEALLPGLTSGPVLGLTWDPVIDHAVLSPTAVLDLLALGALPTNVPSSLGTIL